MKKLVPFLMFSLIFFVVLSLAPLHNVVAQEGTLPTSDELNDGWNFVPGPEGFVCGLGSPYGFFVHPGNPEHLTIHFQVGGGCWDAFTCRAGSGLYTDAVNPEAMAEPAGIFDTTNSQNPLSEYTHIVIPACNGDVHLGDYAATFEPMEIEGETVDEFTFEFRGFSNAQMVLDWVYTNYQTPSSVVVTGASAGSVGSIYHTPYIFNHYSDARLAQIGDSFVGVFPPEGFVPLEIWGIYDNLPDFIPEFEDVTPETGEFASNANFYYEATALNFPDAIIAEFATRNDAVQRFFWVAQGGAEEEGLSLALVEKFETLDSEVPNYSYFLSGGTSHPVMTTPEFYIIAVDEVTYLSWFTDIVEGNPINSVACQGAGCDEADYVGADSK